MFAVPRSYFVVTKMRAAREALERMRPTKMGAALEALNSSYQEMCVRFRGTRSHGLGKRLLAQLAFEACYFTNRQELLEQGLHEALASVCKIDRVVATASDVSLDAIGAISGYKLEKARTLWNQSYRTATPIKGSGSVRRLNVETGPSKPCFPRCRAVIEPNDITGLQPQGLASIVERLTNPKLQLVELALDFPADTMVDTEFIENYATFGKSKPRRVGQMPAYDSWGSRKGSKLVKSYFKGEIFAHRVELEFHAPDIEKYGIDSWSDFAKFATVIPERHISFGRMDHKALAERLRGDGFSPMEIRQIQQRVRNLEWNLGAAMNYLRGDVGLTNATRLLTSLTDVNRVVREALEKWAADWHASSKALKGNK
jgi:hypothetical protein